MITKWFFRAGEYYLQFEGPGLDIKINQVCNGRLQKEGLNVIKYMPGNILRLKPDTFDIDTLLLSGFKSKTVTLMKKGTERDKKIIKLNFEDFPYLGIWSNPEAPFVCIEPWLTPDDKENSTGVFEEREGIVTLEPGEEFTCSFSVDCAPERLIGTGTINTARTNYYR